MAKGNGVYSTHHFTACTSCGQLTRIEVCMPVVTLSDKRLVKFCPMCGEPWNYIQPYANGTGFNLVARAMFGHSPSSEEVELVKVVYEEWDATAFPTFKAYLKSLLEAK